MLLAVLLTPSFSFAQTLTQEEVNAQLLQIINSLMVQVQELMKKLVEVQAKQVADSQVLGAVQQQTAPVVVEKAAPVAPIEFTATKVTDSLRNLTRCIDFTSNNDGVSALVGQINLSPKNTTSQKIEIKAHLDVTGQPTTNKSLFQVYGSGLQESLLLSAGRMDLNLTVNPAVDEVYFWIKEISKPVGVKLTIDSATSGGLEVKGLPVSFDTFGFISCQ